MSNAKLNKAIETAKLYNPGLKVFTYAEVIGGHKPENWELFESCGANSGIPFTFNTSKRIKLLPKDELKIGGDSFLMRNGKPGYTLGIWMEYEDGEMVLVPLSIFRRLPSCKQEREELLKDNQGASLLQKMFDVQRIDVLYSIFKDRLIAVTECNMHQSYYRRLADGSSQFVRDDPEKRKEEDRKLYICYKFNVAK